MKRTIHILVGGAFFALTTYINAAPITWQAVRDVADDADVAVNGGVIKAYTFGSGNKPMVNGVAFQPFGSQTADQQSLGQDFNVGQDFNAFYINSALSEDYNSVLAGGVQDTANMEAAKPQTVTLNGLKAGRKYQVQLWVADNRSWPGVNPAFASEAETVQGSATDTNIPTLHWQGGDKGATAQTVTGTFTADKGEQTLTFTPTSGFFKGKNWFTSQLNALVLLDLSPGVPRPPKPALVKPVVTVKTLDDCNVVWNSPSKHPFGSMPLGNGDIGLNVWVDENGDLVFYISKVDAYDAGHLLPKLGRVRLRFEPKLDVKDFQQTLVLRDAAIEVKAGDVKLKVWVDANSPVIRVEGSSATPRTAVIAVESLRQLADAESALPGATTTRSGPACSLCATAWISVVTTAKSCSASTARSSWKRAGGIMSAASTGTRYPATCVTINWPRSSCLRSCASITSTPVSASFSTRCSCRARTNSLPTMPTGSRSAMPAARCLWKGSVVPRPTRG